MPICHDSKPRRKHRRQKFAATIPRHLFVSRRSQRRRLLRQACIDVAKAQRTIECTLREQGISWRAVEKAVASQVRGEWEHLDKISLPVVGRLREYFASLEQREQAA